MLSELFSGDVDKISFPLRKLFVLTIVLFRMTCPRLFPKFELLFKIEEFRLCRDDVDSTKCWSLKKQRLRNREFRVSF